MCMWGACAFKSFTSTNLIVVNGKTTLTKLKKLLVLTHIQMRAPLMRLLFKRAGAAATTSIHFIHSCDV